jgi:polyribonucleotide nucleotidyltransferase
MYRSKLADPKEKPNGHRSTHVRPLKIETSGQRNVHGSLPFFY